MILNNKKKLYRIVWIFIWILNKNQKVQIREVFISMGPNYWFKIEVFGEARIREALLVGI